MNENESHDLKTAVSRLSDGSLTCVLCRGETICTSTERGVRPLVLWLEGKTDLRGFSAADKVVGKATAFLYALLGVRAVYARVISRSALSVLEAQGIHAEYGTLVDAIVNRRGDGICPFEAAVGKTDDPDAAYLLIREKMREMHIDL